MTARRTAPPDKMPRLRAGRWTTSRCRRDLVRRQRVKKVHGIPHLKGRGECPERGLVGSGQGLFTVFGIGHQQPDYLCGGNEVDDSRAAAFPVISRRHLIFRRPPVCSISPPRAGKAISVSYSTLNSSSAANCVICLENVGVSINVIARHMVLAPCLRVPRTRFCRVLLIRPAFPG